jgi:hypothetical protein
MGKYLEVPVNKGKAEFIKKEFDAISLESVAQAREAFNEGFGVICVVDNGPFEAAAWMFSMAELEAFGLPTDLRPKQWLAMDLELAEELTQ